MGAGFPEQFAPILRTYNAGAPRQEQSLVTASRHKSLEFTAAEPVCAHYLGRTAEVAVEMC